MSIQQLKINAYRQTNKYITNELQMEIDIQTRYNRSKQIFFVYIKLYQLNIKEFQSEEHDQAIAMLNSNVPPNDQITQDIKLSRPNTATSGIL